MHISVVGLGVEGQKATLSLLKRGYEVYASDINREIDLSLLEDMCEDKTDNLDLEIGSHNLDKIHQSDAVAVSPSLFNKKISGDIIDKGIFISDVLDKHKSIKTIAVTGTNGKTTTSNMIYHILSDNGYNTVIGGNGGGGFNGYIDLLLEANENEYEYMVIEVCDMTLDFCNYVFDIDIVVTTNIGYDHMDVHQSIEHYTDEVADFIKNKKAILNVNDENIMRIKRSDNTLFFDTYQHHLNLFGKFNLQNAEAARICCAELNIPDKKIIKSLESFETVEGRTIKFKYNNNVIVTGKTDNVDALKVVLMEDDFDIVFIGTPRKHESCRYNILDYIKEYDPDTLILFPGLEDTTYEYIQYLNKLAFNNDVIVYKNNEDIIKFINSQNNKKIFIGGNGQSKITELTKLLKG